MKKTDAVENFEDFAINGRHYFTSFSADGLKIVKSPEGRIALSKEENGKLVYIKSPGVEPTSYIYKADCDIAHVKDCRTRDLISLSVSTGERTKLFTNFYKGTPRQIIDEAGFVTNNEVDDLGRVTKTIYHDQSSNSFEYDTAGNLTAVIPEARPAHRLYYNVMGDLLSYDAPARWEGTVESKTTYQYDLNKNLKSIKFPSGEEVSYVRDENKDQLKYIAHSRGKEIFTYVPQSSKVQKVTNYAGNSLSYQYDGNRITKETLSINDRRTHARIGMGVEFEQDNNLWLRKYIVNGSEELAYDYDKDGLVTQAGEATFSRNKQTGFVEKVNLETINENFSYNNYGELSQAETTLNNSEIYSYSFERDRLGRIT